MILASRVSTLGPGRSRETGGVAEAYTWHFLSHACLRSIISGQPAQNILRGALKFYRGAHKNIDGGAPSYVALVTTLLLESHQDAIHVLKLYNDLIYYSQAPYCIFVLPESVVFREKSYSQMYAKLQNIKSKTI